MSRELRLQNKNIKWSCNFHIGTIRQRPKTCCAKPVSPITDTVFRIRIGNRFRTLLSSSPSRTFYYLFKFFQTCYKSTSRKFLKASGDSFNERPSKQRSREVDLLRLNGFESYGITNHEKKCNTFRKYILGLAIVAAKSR